MIGLALFLEGNLPFFFVLLCIWGWFPSTSPPGGLNLEGRFNEGFFALGVWGAYIWRGLCMEGLNFRILWYYRISLAFCACFFQYWSLKLFLHRVGFLTRISAFQQVLNLYSTFEQISVMTGRNGFHLK